MRMYNGKRGIVRVIESAIAVMLILGFLIFLQGRQIPKLEYSTSVYKIQHQVLVEVEGDQDMRTSVLMNDLYPVNQYIRDRLKNYPFNFSSRICNLGESCQCLSCPKGTEIYADSVIISTNITQYYPKRLSLMLWFRPSEGVPKTATPIQNCGNGKIEGSEQCDDGNTLSGDGCSNLCTIELPVCGNGKLEGTEQCDDGNTLPGDGCSNLCTLEVAVCGNGQVEFGEDCDGNTRPCYTGLNLLGPGTGNLTVGFPVPSNYGASLKTLLSASAKAICRAGTQSCDATCHWTSACSGQVLPVSDPGALCLDTVDNDCNGAWDSADAKCH